MTAVMTARGSTFVSVPADALMAELNAIGVAIAAAQKGSASACVEERVGHERVVTFLLPGSVDARPAIRVFTSVGVGRAEVRDVGQDAVRIVVGVSGLPDRPLSPRRFIPTHEPQRIFRTAPRNLPDAERVNAFLARLRQALRQAYVLARSIPLCDQCGRPMLKRTGRHGSFLGCSAYPRCTGTRDIPRTET